ncbi:hypothetical protein K0M31_004260 [Melipona bicolor]|uniref:Uncharacterized protein n=1 Tax=Melipona bicolor TaxID=60889 RepID=A0AA40KN45_9HYME|nr:hypothetical protein K0M31_004260 [Melipona bicolor]
MQPVIDASDILKLTAEQKREKRIIQRVDVKFNYVKGSFYEVTSLSVNNEATSKRRTENTFGHVKSIRWEETFGPPYIQQLHYEEEALLVPKYFVNLRKYLEGNLIF